LCFALLDWSCDPLFSPTLPLGPDHLPNLLPNRHAHHSKTLIHPLHPQWQCPLHLLDLALPKPALVCLHLQPHPLQPLPQHPKTLQNPSRWPQNIGIVCIAEEKQVLELPSNRLHHLLLRECEKKRAERVPLP
ncbi:unnamed protein product, partial [Closterium sp. NIES-53]